jgi:hypothetical protein
MRLTCTSDTTNVASWWYNPSINKLQYSYIGFGTGTWATGGALNVARAGFGGAGTQNEALAFGGYAPYPIQAGTCTEEYNGTSWSTANPLINSRQNLAGTGTQAAGLAFGGTDPQTLSVLSSTEEYIKGGDIVILVCCL